MTLTHSPERFLSRISGLIPTQTSGSPGEYFEQPRKKLKTRKTNTVFRVFPCFPCFPWSKSFYDLSLVKEDNQVLRLASGGDDVDFSIAVQVGDFDVFDGDLFGREPVVPPFGAGIVQRGEQFDAGHSGVVHRSPADDDLVGADSQVIGTRQRVAVFEFVVEHFDRWPAIALLIGLRIDRADGAMLRLDGGDEAFSIRQFSVADFASEILRQLRGCPVIFLAVEMPDAFFTGDDDFFLGIVVPVDRVEVVREVDEVADDSKLLLVLRIRRHEVFKQPQAWAVAIFAASTTQRLHE